MRTDIDVFDRASDIAKAIGNGVLLTSKSKDGKVDTMAIGWGTIGIEWGRPIFTAFVREGRLTRSNLDECPEFTVNLPFGEFDRKTMAFCGSRSGRDVDKITEAGLTLVDPVKVSVPAIREFPLTLECRILYRQKQVIEDMPEDIRSSMYPQDVDGSNCGCNRDVHVAYYGEIVASYILD